MQLPPFAIFCENFDFNKFVYDLESSAPQMLKESSSLFTDEQYKFLTTTIATMSVALLRQYHQWIAEQIPE